MEAEERPTKIRKLSHDAGNNAEEILQALDAEPEAGSSSSPLPHTDDLTSSNNNSKPDDSAANGADGEGPENGAADTPKSIPTTGNDKPMSKNQLKKLRKREEWEAGRDYRKVKRKEKTIEKKARKKEAKQAARREQEVQANNGLPVPKASYQKPVKLPVTFVVDCGFDDLMVEKERISLGSQLTRCYSDNYHAPYQAHLMISSWGGLLKERFDTVLAKHYQNWRGVTFVEGDFVEAAEVAKGLMTGPHGGKMIAAFAKYPQSSSSSSEPSAAATLNTNSSNDDFHENGHPSPFSFPTGHQSSPLDNPSKEDGTSSHTILHPEQHPESMQNNDIPANDVITSTSPLSCPIPPPPPRGETIYLTSDSPHTLATLNPYSTYIIGGLVDKNRHKGICYKTACQRGIKTAKLPIGEYMEMQSRFVLATNHVVEIMIRWLECGDWGEAFMKVIPKRKGGRLRGANGGGDLSRELARADGTSEVEACDEDGHDEADNDEADDVDGLPSSDSGSKSASASG